MALVLNVVREGLRNRSLYLLAGVGLLLMFLLLVSSGGTVRDAAGNDLLADAAGAMRVGFALAGFLGALVAVVLSMNTIPREFERGTAELLLVRPLPRWRIGAGFLVGNILSGWLFLLALVVPLFPALTVRGGGDQLPDLLLALPGLLLNVALTAAVTTVLSVWLPGPAAGFLGLLAYVLGAFGPELAALLALTDAWWAPLARTALALVPPTGAVSASVLQRFAPGGLVDPRPLLGGLLYLWASAGVTAAWFGWREVSRRAALLFLGAGLVLTAALAAAPDPRGWTAEDTALLEAALRRSERAADLFPGWAPQETPILLTKGPVNYLVNFPAHAATPPGRPVDAGTLRVVRLDRPEVPVVANGVVQVNGRPVALVAGRRQLERALGGLEAGAALAGALEPGAGPGGGEAELLKGLLRTGDGQALTDEAYIGAVVHEAFHVYQIPVLERWTAGWGEAHAQERLWGEVYRDPENNRLQNREAAYLLEAVRAAAGVGTAGSDEGVEAARSGAGSGSSVGAVGAGAGAGAVGTGSGTGVGAVGASSGAGVGAVGADSSTGVGAVGAGSGAGVGAMSAGSSAGLGAVHTDAGAGVAATDASAGVAATDASADVEAVRAAAAGFLAVRAERAAYWRARLGPAAADPLLEVERLYEWLEGLARYVQAHVEEAGLEALMEELASPVESGPVRNRVYRLGAAQALVLDRLSPGWRPAAMQGTSLEALLRAAVGE
ncbi:hypothetical protein J2Z79_000826 [Symbiobacterium terraclitae]|uniref:Uncharacterized protein n=1 Tax=Symbiobacterium terraclitae TaxID=557451 RepID=A0ABS4JPH4_9FIRM|nr:ABC transporter permease [Symbiobacterium terraclitae]MBP2017443.1 hypothetical protein [Symbiobacterium terraclitae]